MSVWLLSVVNVALLEEEDEEGNNGGDEDGAERGRGCLWALNVAMVDMPHNYLL